MKNYADVARYKQAPKPTHGIEALYFSPITQLLRNTSWRRRAIAARRPFRATVSHLHVVSVFIVSSRLLEKYCTDRCELQSASIRRLSSGKSSLGAALLAPGRRVQLLVIIGIQVCYIYIYSVYVFLVGFVSVSAVQMCT